jgi:hypothetical protein
MNAVRGKFFSVLLICIIEIWDSLASCTRHSGYFPVEVQKACGFDHPNPSSARLKVFTSDLPIPHFTCVPYNIVNFNIDYDDDNYYYDTILRVRGSHARHLIILFLPTAISSSKWLSL